MKNASAKFFAAILISTIAIVSLRAQTNAPDGTALIAVSTNSNLVRASQDPSAVTETNHPARSDKKSQRDNKSAPNTIWNEMVRNCVPLAWVFVSFAIPVAIISICAYARYRRHKMANETLRGMIDKGLTITPELVDSLKSKHSRTGAGATGNQSHKDLRNGLVLTGVGIGVVMLCGKPGWIVLFIGVAFLLIGMLKIGKGDNC